MIFLGGGSGDLFSRSDFILCQLCCFQNLTGSERPVKRTLTSIVDGIQRLESGQKTVPNKNWSQQLGRCHCYPPISTLKIDLSDELQSTKIAAAAN